MITALGCLAMTTAADAAGARLSRCGYGAADMDTVVEMARLDLRSAGDGDLA
jgi:hypothetical protein